MSTITATFVNHAKGFIPRMRLNMDLLRGKTPLATTNNGLLVRAKGLYSLEPIGKIILSRKGTNEQGLPIKYADVGDKIYHVDKVDRSHHRIRLLPEAKDNINAAISCEKLRETIIDQIERVENMRDDGQLGRFDVYEVDQPDQEGGAQYVTVVSKGVSTPGGYRTNISVNAYDKDGNTVESLSDYGSELKFAKFDYPAPQQ